MSARHCASPPGYRDFRARRVLAEVLVDDRRVGAPVSVGADERRVEVAEPAGHILWVRGADDQSGGYPGMPGAELQGDLPAVAVPAHDGAVQGQWVDERGHVVGQLGVRQLAAGVVRAPARPAVRVIARIPSPRSGITGAHRALDVNPPWMSTTGMPAPRS
jgi:hypothetical protein